MINVMTGSKIAKPSDKLFSFGIKVIQKYVINSIGVKLRMKILERRKNIISDPAYEKRLTDLGLRPEKLWWGPMTFSPVKTEILLNEIEKNPPQLLLEVGSGTSSAIFAAAAEKYNFNVLSLENFKPTVNYVEYLLDGLSCSSRLTIQICDLVRCNYSNGEKYRWYNADLASVKQKIDFVLIDGPMSSLVGRNGALPEILPFLAEDHRIFLDDATREHELDCINEWKRHYPNLIVEKPKEDCSFAKLRIPNIKDIQCSL